MEGNSELLSDPLDNRVVKSLLPPPHRPIHKQRLFLKSNVIDWEYLMDFMKKEGRVAKTEFMEIISKAKEILKNQPNLIKVSDPVVIVGDIHGQYYDLIKIIEMGGSPQKVKYLFLGDYVDRGSFAIEVLLLLLSLKITYPDSVYILRGNHQTRQMTSFFNFKAQCIYKYDQEVYQEIMDLFDCLPITALVNNKFFCTHGGLSPQLENISAIDNLDRFQETPKEGALCDFLWADPIENETNGRLGKLVVRNKARGCSFLFGSELTQRFLEQNEVITVIRAHEVQNEGIKFYKWGGKDTFPQVVTVFSAPNYCDVYNNTASIILVKNGLFDVKQFHYSSHPYFLPKFMDVFTWSLPFVSEKLSQMFHHLLNYDYSDSQSGDDELINKTKLVEELYIMQHNQKLYNQNLMSLKGRLPDDKLIQRGLYIPPDGDYDDEGSAYNVNKEVDKENEKRPGQ